MTSFLVFLSLFFVGCIGQSRVDTTLNFDFSNTVPKIYNCPNGRPRLANDTLVEFKLGAITDVFAASISEGPAIALAWRVAVQQVNKLLASINAPFFITLHLEDTRADPALALSAIQKLAGEGVTVILGPATSAEISPAVQDYVRRNKLVLISNGASAVNLKLMDTIFRLFPSDDISAANLAAYALRRGFSQLLVLYRNDDYGNSYTGVLQSAIAQSPSPVPVITIPYAADGSDLNSVLASANSMATGSKVGVIMVTFDEWKDVFVGGSSLPALSKATWLGVDLKGSSTVPANVAANAATTELVDISLYYPSTPLHDDLITTFLSLKVNAVPSYAFVSYDSVFLAFFAFMLPRSDKLPIYAQSLSFFSEALYLSTERVGFDQNGDRFLDNQYVFDRLIGSQWAVVTTYIDGVWTDLKL